MRSALLLLLLLAGCVPASGGSDDDQDARNVTTFDAAVDMRPRQLADAGPPPPDGAADGPGSSDAVVGGDAVPPDALLPPDMAPDGPPPPPAPECDDGRDNDGDGRFDLADPDCSSPADPTERGDDPQTACFNGQDDDEDGFVDWPEDPGCRSAGDDDEADPFEVACANGFDDDEDGLTDFPDDPGCQGRGDADETDPVPAPACANGEDDDGNGATDFPADPGCSSAADPLEDSPCGDLEVIDLNAWLEENDAYVGDLTNAPASLVGACGGAAGGEEIFAYRVDQTLDRLTFSTRHPETEAPVVMYLRRDCLGAELLCDRGAGEDNGVDLTIEAPGRGLYFLVVDTGSRNRVGRYRLEVEAVAPPQCRNGVDDDGDGRVDAADPGCEEAEDPSEADPPEPPACADGVDNDGDGATDYPDDEDCVTAGTPMEAPLCALDSPILRVGQAGGDVELPALMGLGASQGGCAPPLGPEVVVVLDLDEPSNVEVDVTAGGEPAAVVGLYARTDCTDLNTELACRANGGALDLRGLEPGRYFVTIERGAVPPVAPLMAHFVVESLLTECNDEVDNDRDGTIDLADLGCVDGRDDDEGNDPQEAPACADGIDNDGDGAADWPDDDGCSGAGDDDEEHACVGRIVGDECLGCSAEAEHYLEITPGLWACVNSTNIVTYDENFAMCAEGHTPATFDLVNALELRIPTVQEDLDFFAWYRALPVNGDTNYIRTGQKRRGGCELEAHGDLYIRNGVGPNSPGDGWFDLFNGGGSCDLPTGSANNTSHALVGVVCVEGEYAPPHR